MHGMDFIEVEVDNGLYLRACDPFFNNQACSPAGFLPPPNT